jgi:hypothetical protein
MNDETLTKLIRMIEDLVKKQLPKNNFPKTDDLTPPVANKDLAVFFDVSTRTLHSWRKDHGLKAMHISKRIYYRWVDVIEYLQSKLK